MLGRLKKTTMGALSLLALLNMPTSGQSADIPPGGGAVFAMTNATRDNRIVAFRRAANGTLVINGRVSSRGRGIGTDLDTQGALQLSDDNRFLYAANAGSDDISVFAVDGTELTFLQKVPAGDVPNSLTISGNLLYALLGSVAGNGITGFRVEADGTLTPLPNSFRLLSSPIAVPGSIQFSPDGRVLLVTHKVTNVLVPPGRIIDAFTVGADGLPSAAPRPNRSNGLRPFSTDIRGDGTVVVIESFNAAPNRSAVSSYNLGPDGELAVISRSIPNMQTDGCWIIITNDGRYFYTANFGSGTISSYRFERNGEIRLLDSTAARLGPNSQPVDLALSEDGRFLYLLLRGRGSIAAFRIRDDGSLQALDVSPRGLPDNFGISGMAAY